MVARLPSLSEGRMEIIAAQGREVGWGKGKLLLYALRQNSAPKLCSPLFSRPARHVVGPPLADTLKLLHRKELPVRVSPAVVHCRGVGGGVAI